MAANGGIQLDQLQQVAAEKLLGNPTNATADIGLITLANHLRFDSGNLDVDISEIATSLLALPLYTLASLGGVSGSGTTNKIAKFTGSTAIGNSQISDDGTYVTIGTTTGSYLLNIGGRVKAAGSDVYIETESGGYFNQKRVSNGNTIYRMVANGDYSARFDIYNGSNSVVMQLNGNGLTYFNGGNVAIGSSSDDGTNKLQVTGKGKITDNLTLSADKFLYFGSDYIRTNGSRLMTITSFNGIYIPDLVGMGTTPNASYRLYVSGDTYTSGIVHIASSSGVRTAGRMYIDALHASGADIQLRFGNSIDKGLILERSLSYINAPFHTQGGFAVSGSTVTSGSTLNATFLYMGNSGDLSELRPYNPSTGVYKDLALNIFGGDVMVGSMTNRSTGKLQMTGSISVLGTTNNTYRWDGTSGTPTDTSANVGWVKISLAGVDAWLPYYQ